VLYEYTNLCFHETWWEDEAWAGMNNLDFGTDLDSDLDQFLTLGLPQKERGQMYFNFSRMRFKINCCSSAEVYALQRVCRL